MAVAPRPDQGRPTSETRPRPPRLAVVSCCGPRCSTPTTCAGPTPASRTRSSSATTAPTTSSSSASTRAASRSPAASPTIIEGFEAVEVPVGALDVAFYRDDIALRPVQPLGPTEVPVDIVGPGRRARRRRALHRPHGPRRARRARPSSAGPRAVQLAVLVDRGHRELPIRADFVGKNLPDQRGRRRARAPRRDRRRTRRHRALGSERPRASGGEES